MTLNFIGITLTEKICQGKTSFVYENEHYTVCIGEDCEGSWFGFLQVGESEINAYGDSMAEVCSNLKDEVELVRNLLLELMYSTVYKSK